MNPILYLEGACGISGDMTVAALLALGGSEEKMKAALASLPLEGYDYSITQSHSHSIAGTRFRVNLHHEQHHHNHNIGNHHHPEDYNHGHDHAIGQLAKHKSDGLKIGYEYVGHDHGHRPVRPQKSEEKNHNHYHAPHLNLHDIEHIIKAGQLTPRAQQLALRCFAIVAAAEAKAHGCAIEQVHFHEVGALDSIVDIVAAAVLIDDLGIEECIVTGLTTGSGTVTCQHGILPVPVPAVLNIAEAHHVALRPSDLKGEMVTPTGIALAATICTSKTMPERYSIARIGIGLGQKDFGSPNCLRAMLIVADKDEVVIDNAIHIIECNIDDSTGEELGHALEKLFEAGARDAHYMPCFMKKNRPAWLLRVICDAHLLNEMEHIIFAQTSCIGVRYYPVQRSVMQREWVTVNLAEGQVLVKHCWHEGHNQYYPQFESVKRLVAISGEGFRIIYNAAAEAARQQHGKH